MKSSLESAVVEATERRAAAVLEVRGAVPGLYVQFESLPGVPLQITKLEDVRQGIEVVAVNHRMSSSPEPLRIERATVFVPDGKVKHFLERFESYSNPAPKIRGERRHEDMIDPIATLRLATLRGLWTDTEESYPDECETLWWEVWLRRHDGNELERLMEFAGAHAIEVSARRLVFDDRIVILARTSAAKLATSVDVLNDFAEVRKAKETAHDFDKMPTDEQGAWVNDLRDRIVPPSADAPAVCVLDTGVTCSHPLLVASLDVVDCHSVNPVWGTHDHHGHGTEMAGLALFGDLVPILSSTDKIALQHRLESVKVLPPQGQAPNQPELYGAVVAEAMNRAEIQAPKRRRTFSMAIATTDTRDRGQPTSWSAAIDALAAGRTFDPTTQGLSYLGEDQSERRLIVLAAGNVDGVNLAVDHLARSDIEPVHDPGQAWNAITVGAMTERASISDATWSSWKAVAPAGDLSPWSTTGVTFAAPWPIKPDVVFEGGNIAKNGINEVSFPVADLSLLSTYFEPAKKPLVLSWATSAASAQVSRLAARISAEYPNYWPETLRALVVHSAEWSSRMKNCFRGVSGKRALVKLVQRYGFGVPDDARALRSANDALTLVVQAKIHPFEKGKMREIHFFELPWPKTVLEDLGDTQMRLRVTLSYFVEPNPARRGWKNKHRYASHGLRFDMKGPTESTAQFRKRLNETALDEDEEKPTSGSESSKWLIGERARSRGSLHADMLECDAAELASRGTIAVYPVSGWWKDQPKRDRSALGARYALVVSIESPSIEADIWTPVAQQVGIATSIEA